MDGKALLPVKAQPLDTDELTAWFEGRVPRRILSIPFGGPFPSPKSALGVDLDGEWFGPDVDIYGPYPELRQTRERLADWHHAFSSNNGGDPTGMMRGRILGKSILDPDPEADGWWSDFWFKAGEKRVELVKRLAERGAQLFGSSQPAPKGVVIDETTGEIKVWPHLLQTLTTSPQNTLSVVVPAKAMLDDLNDPGLAISPALRGVIDGLLDLGADLTPTRGAGEDAAKAGRAVGEHLDEVLEDALTGWKIPQP